MSDAGRRPIDLPATSTARPEPQRIGPSMSFRARLTIGFVLSAVLPLTVFGVVLLFVEVVRTGDLDANLGNTVSTETLLDRGWGDTDDADPSYVWVTMRRLRQKIEPDPDRPIHIVTVRGVGYRLVQQAAPTA